MLVTYMEKPPLAGERNGANTTLTINYLTI